ncbi:SPARC-like [Ptychodera flava]|uniref:SPARC-like n=1 Tax=Ptychodera flava TaxID=63121 RepID=UPI00396A6426
MAVRAVLTVLMLFLCVTTNIIRAQQETWKELWEESDPCATKKCKKPAGSMCEVVEKNGRKTATCVCPTECPHQLDRVCSVYGRQYDNLCQLHLEACNKKKHIGVAYKGKCIASQDRCENDEIAQFPHRLLQWFQHLREVDEFGTVDMESSISTLSVQRRQALAQWKFNELDRKGDGKLDRRDLKNFRYALMPLEHCASKFFNGCDADSNKKITLEEWFDCLEVESYVD